MKYTAEELLVAADLRNIVTARLKIRMPADLSAAEQATWKRDNLDAVTKDAIDELLMFAARVRQQTAAQNAPE